MGVKKLVIWGHSEVAVDMEYSRKHEHKALKLACLKLKRPVPAAIITWDASEYD